MGKKSGPAPPPPPDPVATAQAQATVNKDAAVSQANLNRIDQYNPQGSLNYVQIGKNEDGTPQYAQYQQYSAPEQAKYDASNNITLALDNLAQSNVGRVADAQATPFSYDGMSPMETRVGYNLPGINSGPQSAPDMVRNLGDQGSVATGYNSGGYIQNRFDSGPQVSALSPNAGGPIQRDVNDVGITRSFYSGGPLSYMGAGAGGAIQSGLNTQGLTAVPNSNDFGAEGQRVGDAVYGQAKSRLDSQFDQEQEGLTASLANQGISNNSDAYRQAMDNFNSNKTDAYNQANFSSIQAGAAEQQRLFQNALSARGQQFGEAQSSGQFTNAAQSQAYGQIANTLAHNNATTAQSFGQNKSLADFYNSSAGQQFSQNLQGGQFSNAAQGQAYGQAANTVAQNNAAQGQIFGQNNTLATFNNQAQAQQNQQNQQAAAFNNMGQDQRFQQSQAQADLYNSTGQQQFGDNQSAAAFNNQARTQAFNEQLTNANLSNAGRQQQIEEQTYLRNLPLNEIASLLGTGTGVQNPTFQNVSQVGVAAPDYQGAVYANYNGANQQYQAQQQARSQMLGAIFGSIGSIGSAAAMSDRRMKQDIERVGTLPNGLATYAFNYIGDKVRQFGVMAQEVLDVIPDAVHSIDGILHVDYRKVYA